MERDLERKGTWWEEVIGRKKLNPFTRDIKKAEAGLEKLQHVDMLHKEKQHN